MAGSKEPPPLLNDEENEKEEHHDLFVSAFEDQDSDSLHPLDDRNDNVIKDDIPVAEKLIDKADIFEEPLATTEICLDSPDDAPLLLQNGLSSAPKLELFDRDNSDRDSPPKLGISETISSSTSYVTAKKSSPTTDSFQLSKDEVEDKYYLDIHVREPRKMGDGMNAYIAYNVLTKTNLPDYEKNESSVYRRFSDFLGLHEKIAEKHQAMGCIIPTPPEKSVLGMTKIKMSKEESTSMDFVERRRAALERYLVRLSKHLVIRSDTNLIAFLESEADLPKSSSTSALSGAGFLRLFTKVGDSLGKIAFKIDEVDQWFEEKYAQIELMDQHLRKLHNSVESLVSHRKELSSCTGYFAKSVAMLGNAEEHTALSRALSQLAEVEENLDQLHLEQADSDFYLLSELLKDYLNLLSSVKDVFHLRVKTFRNWKECEQNLNKKREMRAKLELSRKLDKIPSISQEVTELERKVDRGQQEFEQLSENIRKELGCFEIQRVKDFKQTIVKYLENLMNNQQKAVQHWEAFLPEAKAIA